jgi:hypothetical protein
MRRVLVCLAIGAACSGEPASTVAPASTVKTSGGRARTLPTGFAGVGWSTDAASDVAVRNALAHAEPAATKQVAMTFVYYTPHHDPTKIARTLRAIDPKRRIMGMTTHDAVLTADGYHSSPDGALGVLSVATDNTTVGLGAAGFDEVAADQLGDAARLALERARTDAKQPRDRVPTMVLVFPTLGSEERALAALKAELGPDVPVIGGTPAGPSKETDPDRLKHGLEWSSRGTSGAASKDGWTGSIIVDDQVILKGAAIAVFYAAKPFAWAFDGGFERSTTKFGVITHAEPRLIRKIDNRPALDVYNEWVDGGMKEAMARGANMLQWCALHPLIRTLKAADGKLRSQFLHAFPNADQANEPGSMVVGANVVVGETLSLGEGSWNILLNRFAQIPRQAKLSQPIDPVAGLFFYCAGALDTIPREHRPNMASLVSESMGNELPWIGAFSWGEQGHIRGVGNLHGNEMASTVLFAAQ